ncbi:Head domain of trimeric autotransporter adhesin [Variovorax sp. HW608]|uniref:YadA family autotransporter adhesin n=1 Tax=Variovorax sp. HW608 TaxID=1034889 RepID=UPI0008201EF8|nr:YadA-like family protein [Variovorax sp. HW608]SCK09101.1 Head domain of trimeric autotransporter adhesin [Variovorax sp. HW608]
MKLKYQPKRSILTAALAAALVSLTAPTAFAGVLMCQNEGLGAPGGAAGAPIESTVQAWSEGGEYGAAGLTTGRLGFIAGATTSTQCPAGSNPVGFAATADELNNMLTGNSSSGNPNAVLYNNGGTPAAPGTVTVADGVNGKDAVNVDQLNNGMSNTLNSANQYTDNSVSNAINNANSYTDARIGDTYNYVDGKVEETYKYVDEKTKYFKANSTGAESVVTGNDSIAIGPGTVVAGDRSIAGGVNAVASGDDSVVFGNNAKGTATGTVAVGSGAEAVNVGDVAMGFGAIATGVSGVGSAVAIGVGNKATGAGAVAIGDPSIATGTGAVALGFNSIATADGTASGGAADGAIAMGNASVATGQGSVALGNLATTGAAGGVAIGDTAKALQGNGIALGSGSTATHANDVALGAGSTTAAAVATTGATINSVEYTFAGAAPTSTVSVGAEGSERTITNVAAGRLSATSTDAINGSQLDATNRAVTAIGSNIAGNNTQGLPPAVAPGNNSVAIGPGSVADRDNTISFGTPGAERQLANVAPGVAATDATNLGQVQSMVGSGVQQANAYTDQQIQALDAKTKKQMAGVGAMAMASSALVPNARAEGNSSISMAAGTYGGESAIAAGVNYYASNQILLNAKVAATSSGPSRVGFAIGATIGF